MRNIQTLQGLAKSAAISLIAAFIVVVPFQQSFASAPAISASTYYDGTCNLGDGVPSNHLSSATAFEITNPDQLWEVTDCLDPSAPVYFKLANGIDVNGAQYAPTASPIGNSSTTVYSFSGVIDGQNNQIFGISMSSSVFGVGLFAHLQDSEISRVTISGSVTYSGTSAATSHSAGLLAVFSSGHITVSNVATTGEVNGRIAVGGLVGETQAAHFSHVANRANVTATHDFAGGLVGEADGDVVIIGSSNQGVINADEGAGGLLGYAYYGIEVSNSQNFEPVSGDDSVGGLIGAVDYPATISASSNYGDVDGAYRSGGLVGTLFRGGTFRNVQNFGDVFGSDETGGIVATSWNGGPLSIFESANYGHITGTDWTGGLAGYVVKTLVVEDSINTGTVSATSIVAGGLVGAAVDYAVFEGAENSGHVTGSNHVGGILGIGFGNVWLEDLTNSARIEANDKVGGLAGGVRGNAVVRTATNLGDVIGGLDVGGLVGSLSGQADVYLAENQGKIGLVTAVHVGGLFGTVATRSFIIEATNSGNVIGASEVGGFAGQVLGGVEVELLTNTRPIVGGENVGGLFGYISGSSLISASANSGNVSATTTSGGLIGFIDSARDLEIKNSRNSGNIVALDQQAGGIVGRSEANYTYLFRTLNTGDVTAGLDTAGGLVGFGFEVRAEEIANSGNISASSEVGGLAGIARVTSLIDSYNSGNITGNSYVGGFLGSMQNTVTSNLDSLYQSGEVVGNSDAEGLIGNSASSTVNVSFVFTTVDSVLAETVTLDFLRSASNLDPWSFTRTWGYGACTFNQGLPLLRYFNQVETYYEDSCFSPPTPSSNAESAPAQYLGPTIRAIMSQVQVGEQVVIQGSRLDSVTAVEIAGVSQEVIKAESNSLTFKVNPETEPGVHDLVLFSSYGLLTVQQGIRVERPTSINQPVTETQASELTGRTKLLSRNQSLAQAWLSENLTDSGVTRLVCTVTVTSAATMTQRIQARKLAKQSCDQAAQYLESPSIWFQTKSTNTKFVGRVFLTFKG